MTFLFWAILLGVVLEPSPASAYIDPNAGELILQLLTPILAIVAVAYAWVRHSLSRLSSGAAYGVRLLRSSLSSASGSGFSRIWLGMTVLACLLFLLHCLVYMLVKIDGWFWFQTPWQVWVTACWHILVALAEGLVVGTMAAIAAAMLQPIARRLGAEKNAAMTLALVAGAALALLLMTELLLRWIAAIGSPSVAQALGLPLRLAVILALGGMLLIPASRRRLLPLLSQVTVAPQTRRGLLLTGGAALLSVVAGRALTAPATATAVSASPPQPRANILLVTFDALSAEDMSLYGADLPTTPNIDAFAKSATTFSNFFACSTFTTSSVAALLTGTYPSRSRVLQLQGQLREADRGQTLFSLLRQGGYRVAASVANPYAHPDRLGVQEAALETATLPTRNSLLSGLLTRSGDPVVFAYAASQEALVRRLSEQLTPPVSEFPAAMSFAQAREMLTRMPADRPFFLWVHCFAPHMPFQPSAPYLGRFTKDVGMRKTVEQALQASADGTVAQDKMDLMRLRHREFMAESDAAFGSFMRELDQDGRLDNTAVLLSSDHGESFEGGIYTHDTPELTRPILHIPLVIRPPGGGSAAISAAVADQTSLAPTMLALAGLPVPPQMQGRSLLSEMKDGASRSGLAFSQYLARNAISERITSGTVSVTDGKDQYIVNLATRNGLLRDLSLAHLPHADQSAERPERAKILRQMLFERFPELPGDDG